MGSAVEFLQWNFGFFTLRLPKEKMHNLTLAVGLVVCMGAGATTVYTDTFSNKEGKSIRLFRAAKKAKRRSKEYLTDLDELWN